MTDMVVSTSDNQILSFNYKPSIEAKKFSIKGVKNGSVTVSIEVTDIFEHKNKITASVIVIGKDGLKSKVVDGTGITGQFTAKNGEVTWQYENPYRVIFTDVETNQQIDNTFPIYELTEIKRDGEIVTKAKIRFYIFAGYFCVNATEYEPKANTEHFELTFKVYDNYGYVTEEDAATIIINNVILVKE